MSPNATPADRAFAEAAAQGLPKYVEDPRVLDRIAAIFLASEQPQGTVRPAPHGFRGVRRDGRSTA